MLKKLLLLSLFGGAMLMGCEKDPPAPEPPPPPVEIELPDTNNYGMPGDLPCFSCANETVSETYKDVPAIVTKFWHDPIRGVEFSTIFSITKADVARGTSSYTLHQDSILVPCKRLPWGYDSVGKRVKISGQLMSCGQLLSCPNCFFLFGRKFILTKIKPI